MGNTMKSAQRSVMAEIEENQRNVRGMVLESYRDMQAGKGRDYKEFFDEMGSRYDNGNTCC